MFTIQQQGTLLYKRIQQDPDIVAGSIWFVFNLIISINKTVIGYT